MVCARSPVTRETVGSRTSQRAMKQRRAQCLNPAAVQRAVPPQSSKQRHMHFLPRSLKRKFPLSRSFPSVALAFFRKALCRGPAITNWCRYPKQASKVPADNHPVACLDDKQSHRLRARRAPLQGGAFGDPLVGLLAVLHQRTAWPLSDPRPVGNWDYLRTCLGYGGIPSWIGALPTMGEERRVSYVSLGGSHLNVRL
jgi:hypothetical protein